MFCSFIAGSSVSVCTSSCRPRCPCVCVCLNKCVSAPCTVFFFFPRPVKYLTTSEKQSVFWRVQGQRCKTQPASSGSQPPTWTGSKAKHFSRRRSRSLKARGKKKGPVRDCPSHYRRSMAARRDMTESLTLRPLCSCLLPHQARLRYGPTPSSPSSPASRTSTSTSTTTSPRRWRPQPAAPSPPPARTCHCCRRSGRAAPSRRPARRRSASAASRRRSAARRASRSRDAAAPSSPRCS